VDDFLPPEERFYAGGATTVRGYGRNELGPGVYVTSVRDSLGIDVPGRDTTFVPLGGTSLGVLNLELRFPSPILRRQMRLAAFLDGGVISNDVDAGGWRFTPGVGVRITTPVGPARVDVGYNPYDPVSGVLFQVAGDSITPVRDNFRPATPGFFGRMRLHVAIGQAF
jgi:outer membrane protein assembly factor BamA